MTFSYLWGTTGGPICLSPHQQHVTGGTDSIAVPLLLQDPMCQVQGAHLQTIHCRHVGFWGEREAAAALCKRGGCRHHVRALQLWS